MNNKRLMLIILILITILITTATSSANNNTDMQKIEIEKNIQYDNNIQEKILKEDENAVNVNSYSQLYDAITTANDENKNKTINLYEGDYNITQDIEIKPNKKAITITINGNNNTINGNNQKSFISIQRSNTLIMNNVIIENTTSNKANAIQNLGNCILNNITIKNTYSIYNNSSSGGAIYNSGSMKIYKSNFINNRLEAVTFGGAVIYNSKNLTLVDSYFENNTSRDGSAIYCLTSKNTIIENCIFKDNTAESSTIYNFNSNISIKNSYFKSNKGKYSVAYILQNGQITLSDCQITGHSSSDGLIHNDGEISIINGQIFNNSVNKSLFSNNNSLCIKNNTIQENNGSIVINNKDTSILNSKITSNNAIKTLTENINETAIIKIENSTFTNNTSKYICYENISTTIISNTSYYNNTCEELFEANTTNIHASNNTYIGNRLYSQLICDTNYTFNYDEDIQISGMLKTKDVYNTTVSNVNLSVYLNESKLSDCEIHSNIFHTYITEKINSSNLRIIFEAMPDYKECNITIHIEILYPEYEVKIISNESVDYDSPFNYTVSIKNTGNANGSNIQLSNILPANLHYISSDNITFNDNLWLINSLKTDETKNITLTVKSISSENICLKVVLNDLNLNESTYVEKIIYVNKADISMNLSYNNENLTLTDKLKINISIDNKEGRSGNITVKINVNGIDTYNTLFKSIASDEIIKINYESLINKTGKYKINITVYDETFNITKFRSIEFDIKKPILIVDNVNGHVNDSVNLKAHTLYLNSLDNSTIVFKVNNITITQYPIKIDNSTVCIENFVIPSNWKKNNYTLEVKLYKKGLESTLTNSSIIAIDKLNVYSIMYNITGFPNEKINLTAIITDERNQKVNIGFAIFKINSITIKEKINVRNGVVLLKDYVIPENYRAKTYNLSLVYAENCLYHFNRNTSTIVIQKEESDIDITNTTFIRNKDFTIHAHIYRKSNMENATDGKAIVKINRKTVSGVLDVSNGEVSFTYPKIPIREIDCIVICYSGNNRLLPTVKVVGINKFNYGK